MQSASVNYIQAASGAGGQWAEPSVMADWLRDGYSGTFDDISGQVGSWTVEHHLDDGYPDSVTFISGSAVPTLSADLGPPPAYLTGGVPMQVSAYYSPYNTDSPLYGLERDVAPTKLAHGVVGAGGPERITVFTGQMTDIPVIRGQASLQATSATRLKLAKSVQPPAVNGLYQGANATWPITNVLAQCGVYAMPPPQTGVRWWAPMHGSVRPFLPDENAFTTDVIVTVDNLLGLNRTHPIRTCDGPFVAAIENGVNPSFVQRTILSTAVDTIEMVSGPDLISQVGIGKFESWVRGDDANLNFWPGGSGGITSLYRLQVKNTNGSGADVLIRSDTRKVQATLTDGTNTASIISTNPFPTDGAWHFVGFAWDVAQKKVWINVDGVVQSATNASIVIGTFPTLDQFGIDQPNPQFTLPCAECQLTAGISPDTGPWLRDIPFTAQAVVNKSAMELANIAEPVPQEAWAYLSKYAQAELAAMRTDELDIFTYLTCGWWVKAAQQVVAETYSTELNAEPVDINIDPTKIRNQIVVSFSEVITVNVFQTVFSTTETIVIPPGISDITLPFSRAAFEIRGTTFQNIAAVDTVQPSNVNSVSFNSASDGSGTYYSSSTVSVRVTSWTPGEVSLEFNNKAGITVYTANDKNWPTLTVAAKAQDSNSTTITESDTTSTGIRGERSLPVSNDVLQTRVNARRLARRLLMGLRTPQPAAEPLTLFGEARRQPGDLVAFEDPSMTRVSGLWRAESVNHTYKVSGNEVAYTNEVVVRPTRDILIIGEGTIGNTLIGPTQ